MLRVPPLLRVHFALACGAFLFSAVLFAAQTSIPAAPDAWVTDTAHFMSPAVVSNLNARLKAYEQQTHHQLIVWIGTTTGGVPIEDWATKTFNAWGIGRKGMNDGLALFVMSEDHKLRIEVGYGLEAQVPDAAAARVIQDILIPQIRAGNPDGAIVAAMEALTKAVGGSLPSGDGKIADEPRPVTRPETERGNGETKNAVP
jgi:uncharacterized protein